MDLLGCLFIVATIGVDTTETIYFVTIGVDMSENGLPKNTHILLPHQKNPDLIDIFEAVT